MRSHQHQILILQKKDVTVDPALAESHQISIENASSVVVDDKHVEWTSLDAQSFVLVLFRYHVFCNQSVRAGADTSQAES
jgi:hypothetical protein